MRPEARVRRYALPVLLAVLAVAGLLTARAMRPGGATGAPVTGDASAGLAVRLAQGRTYFLYVRRDGSSPFGCAVAQRAERATVRLTRRNSWNAADLPGRRYTASFRAPVTGRAVLTCRGTDGPLLVAPDGSAGFYAGLAFLAALAACAAAAAGSVAVLARRAGRSRARVGRRAAARPS